MPNDLAGDVLSLETISQRVDQLMELTDDQRRIRLGICAALENPIGSWLPGPLLSHVINLGDVDASVSEADFVALLYRMCEERLLARNGAGRFFKLGLTWIPPEGLEEKRRRSEALSKLEQRKTVAFPSEAQVRAVLGAVARPQSPEAEGLLQEFLRYVSANGAKARSEP